MRRESTVCSKSTGGAPHPTPRILHAATPPACCTRRRHKRPARTAVRDLRPAMYAKKPAGIQSAPPLASTREGLHTPAFPAPLADCPTPKPPVCVVAHSQLFRRQLGIITWWASALKEVCGSGFGLAHPLSSTPEGSQVLLFLLPRRSCNRRPTRTFVGTSAQRVHSMLGTYKRRAVQRHKLHCRHKKKRMPPSPSDGSTAQAR